VRSSITINFKVVKENSKEKAQEWLKTRSPNIEMSLEHCTNQRALLCNKMFYMVWQMWSSIDLLKQFSLGGNPYTHLQMCTFCALLPFSRKNSQNDKSYQSFLVTLFKVL
jgi:hypothetical protein